MSGPEEGPPPEAVLIQDRRDAMIPRMGMRRAAELAARALGASFAEATWRQIEGGKYKGPADRVAAMAMVVIITADELEACGRPDAARILREELRRRKEAEPGLVDVDSEATPEAVIQLIFRGLDQIRNAEGLSDDQKRDMERSLMHSVKTNLGAQLDQIRTTLKIVEEKSRR